MATGHDLEPEPDSAADPVQVKTQEADMCVTPRLRLRQRQEKGSALYARDDNKKRRWHLRPPRRGRGQDRDSDEGGTAKNGQTDRLRVQKTLKKRWAPTDAPGQSGSACRANLDRRGNVADTSGRSVLGPRHGWRRGTGNTQSRWQN